VRANGTVTYDSFNGDIEFNVNNNESERWISPKNSYLSIRLRIVQTDEAGTAGCLQPVVNADDGTHSKAHATLVSIPYINPNPGACLFQAVGFNIGEETISNNQNLAQCNTLYRTLYESEAEQRSVNSTNPIKYMTITDTDIGATKTAVLADYFPATYGATAGTTLSNRKLWALKNMMGFNKYNEVEINTQCFAPIMYSDDLIPPNTPFSIRLTTDPNFYYNLINIAGSNVSTLPNAGATNLTIGRLTSASSNSGTANNISVAVVDMNLWLHRVHMPNSTIPKEIYIKQYSATVHTITGQHDEFNIDFKKNRRLTHIACAFIQKKGAMKCCPTDFSSGYYIGAINGTTDTPSAAATTEAITYSNSPIAQLLNIRIEYAGSVYPFQPYNYNFDYTTKGGGQSNGNYRAFYDYCNYSDGLRDRSGTLLDMSQYSVAPIVLFKTFQNPDNDGNNCLCTVDFKTASNITNNCYLLVMAMYDEVCTIHFDEFAKYKGFEIH